MKFATFKRFIAVFSLFVSSASFAGMITQSEYDQLTTHVDFNLIANDELLSDQYQDLGVTFSGEIVGRTNGDGVFSSTSVLTYYAPNRTDEWTATFSNGVTSVGFFAEYWQADVINLEVYNQGAFVAEYDFFKSNNNIFDTELVGVTESEAFDEIRFSISGNGNHFFNMDDFKFNVAAVSEPSAFLLFGLGLAGLMVRRSKK